ncbi:MAG: hypothetical protein ACE14V_01330 [bacterium]
MTYNSHDFSEAAGSEDEKIDWLNELETQYEEATAYLDTLTHSSRYYTKAECDSKYFSASTDGTGSGLVCETLGGYTAQQMINMGIPSKVIGIWPNSEASIPSGWYLCDGLNGTPYLIGRIPICAGDTYNVGDTGGNLTQTAISSALTIGTHALTVDELPAHTHGYTDNYRNNSVGAAGSSYGVSVDHAGRLTDSATSVAHGHSSSAFTGTEFSILPPSMALCYIMRGEI